MSKFNQTNSNKTKNLSGYDAYKMTPKALLVSEVLTSMFREQKFYGDTSDAILEHATELLAGAPQFVANLARYARREFHLRSVSHALTAVVANHVNGKPFIGEVVADVVERPDDITEILSCYLSLFGKPIPNGLKRALGKAIGKFTPFQISKYNGGSKAVKFRDVLRITHAKPQGQQQEALFQMIMSDTLPVAERWETVLSEMGNTTEAWEKLIAENKLGYMAMLRNLRSILAANPSNLQTVLDKLSDRQAVLASKQLPFRFFSAYREVKKLASGKVLSVLEDALSYSVENLPKLSGMTVIAIDTSGSMNSPLSHRSEVSCADVARLLAVLASKICEDYVVYSFDTELKKVTFSKNGGIIETALHVPVLGGGTDLLLPLEEMIGEKLRADRLLLFSDNEINYGWESCPFWKQGDHTATCQQLAHRYRKEINPDLWVHAVDLMGYGTQQFIGGKTNLIAGWSERVLEFISLVEAGLDGQVAAIESYK